MQINNAIKEYINIRENIVFILLGVMGIVIFTIASEKTLSSIGLKPIWLLICAILLYIGNLQRD